MMAVVNVEHHCDQHMHCAWQNMSNIHKLSNRKRGHCSYFMLKMTINFSFLFLLHPNYCAARFNVYDRGP